MTYWFNDILAVKSSISNLFPVVFMRPFVIEIEMITPNTETHAMPALHARGV